MFGAHPVPDAVWSLFMYHLISSPQLNTNDIRFIPVLQIKKLRQRDMKYLSEVIRQGGVTHNHHVILYRNLPKVDFSSNIKYEHPSMLILTICLKNQEQPIVYF